MKEKMIRFFKQKMVLCAAFTLAIVSMLFLYPGTILPFCLRPAHPQNDKRKGYEGDECHVNGHQHTGEEAEQNRPP